ncbi:MAG: hypothetical protein ACI33M_09635 [Lysinibacillus sp.]
MNKTLRGIGIGLFLAGATFTVIQQFDEPISQENASTYKKQIKDLEQQLAEAQEQLTTIETSTPIADTDEDEQEATNNTEEKQQAPEQIDNTKQSSEENVVYGTILIYEGVSLYDIGKQAEDAGIIKNGRELELYLYKPEYARSLQKGQFELHSAMTLEQMAKILTGKKVE